MNVIFVEPAFPAYQRQFVRGLHAVGATVDGGCWATLWATGSVVRLDRDGRITTQETFAQGAEPHGLAVVADGSVRVALQSGQVAHVVAD